MKSKPKVFIASSTEGLRLAETLHSNLDFDADVTSWHAGFYRHTASTMETLDKKVNLDNFHYAVFVFSDDDILRIRGKRQRAVRDNVLFELALFIGRLGRDRCFILTPRNAKELRIPTDLLGFTPLTYNSKRADNNLSSALVPASRQIKDVFDSLEYLSPKSKKLKHKRKSRKSRNLPKAG